MRPETDEKLLNFGSSLRALTVLTSYGMIMLTILGLRSIFKERMWKMATSRFRRKSVAVALIASILFLAVMLLAAAAISAPQAVAAPSPPDTYSPSSTPLSVRAGHSDSFDLTVELSFEPEPGWWVDTVVEAVSPGPFDCAFDLLQPFRLDANTTSKVVHVTVTAPEGAGDGSFTIKAKQVSTSGPPGVGRGAGCEVTITVLEAPTPTPTPTATATPTSTPTANPTPGDEGDGACFIATAAYGTPLVEEIQVLRQFRDEYLLTNPAGRLLVSLYYTTSPPVADLISKHEGLRAVTRIALEPIIWFFSRITAPPSP